MMALQNISIKTIVVVAILSTMFETTTAGFGDFVKSNEHSGDCVHTSCDRHPKCPSGYDTLGKTKDDCSTFKEKKYCCRRGKGPQCFATGCGTRTSCPRNYYAIDHTKHGCSGTQDNSYCCKSTDLPVCFDLSCPALNEAVKYCPLEYKETARAYGQLGGCESDSVQRVTCCFPVEINSTTGNQSTNAGFKQNVPAVFSKNGTIKWEDGRIQIVVKHSNESLFDILFGNSNSSFSSFSQLSLLLPILIVLSAFNKLI